MTFKRVISSYNLLLFLGAFYVGALLLLGEGVFGSFPPEWIGKMPFNSWATIAIFGMSVFGIGNAVVSIYGFKKNGGKKFYIVTVVMGLLLFLSSVSPVILLGEWYLPLAQLCLVSVIQILLGLFGLIRENSK
ncbi:hypothetical protein [Ornithinibacillus halophilus]|uniref:Uncharacterized protein n=1 Tax=Ornithinibacillus halophilus TaxID=930117 RepID=A0A1M5L9F2_9BACI|nr:hypothetical protein [Ornithinibacillus halophilus]SHG61628.1 hypothetical protein SAMN05216225_104519 [Ornithinibacillus halophilus]